MKYANIKKHDIANGPGVRVSLFVSGCNHHCKGCFNSIAWDFNYGNEFTNETIDEIIKSLDKNYIEGLSLLGGEPLEEVNQPSVLQLIKKVKETLPNKTIWLYSGFTYEEIIDMKTLEIKDILNNIDVLVDGKFEIDLYDPALFFRGSSNQRIIDVKETLQNKKIILHEKNIKEEFIKQWIYKILKLNY